jgi:glycerol-3-phosphate dehydrogenase
MAEQHADIIIHGGGIAGLWILNLLKNLGYDALLIEPHGIGGIQTIASQGIIHSGLKYVLGGKINPLARAISTMPEVWKSALRGEGPLD